MVQTPISNWAIEVLVKGLTKNRFSADELRDILHKLSPSDRSRLFVELDRVMKQN